METNDIIKTIVCDFCKILLADNKLQNGSYICYQCCDDMNIPHPREVCVNGWLIR